MSQSRSSEPLRVLLAEDSMQTALLVRTFLGQAGPFTLATAQDGDHAARLLREQRFDLLITDLNLPGLDGFGLIRIAKRLDPDRPVLAITGYTTPGYQDEAYRAGADHVLIKPLDRDEFVAKVASLLPGAAGEPGPAVLAVGGRPGDVELGCGGTLVKHREEDGDELLVLPLSASLEDGGTETVRRAAEMLGARVIISEVSVKHAEDPGEHQLLLERIVREVKPRLVYLPSLGDDDPDRREAHRLTRSAVADVPDVRAYETATTTPEFHPSRFEDVSAHMVRKLEALTAYHAQAAARPELSSAFAQAHSRYWGRFGGFGEVEPFEVLRMDGSDVA